MIESLILAGTIAVVAVFVFNKRARHILAMLYVPADFKQAAKNNKVMKFLLYLYLVAFPFAVIPYCIPVLIVHLLFFVRRVMNRMLDD